MQPQSQVGLSLFLKSKLSVSMISPIRNCRPEEAIADGENAQILQCNDHRSVNPKLPKATDHRVSQVWQIPELSTPPRSTAATASFSETVCSANRATWRTASCTKTACHCCGTTQHSLAPDYCVQRAFITSSSAHMDPVPGPQPEYHQHIPYQEPASSIRFQNPGSSTSTEAIFNDLLSPDKKADTSLHSDNSIYDPPIDELHHATVWETLNHSYYQQRCVITDELFHPFFKFPKKDHEERTEKIRQLETASGKQVQRHLCYGFEQQQRSERASRSRNCTAAREYLRSIECQLCE